MTLTEEQRAAKPRHKCDRRIGAVCVYLCRECAYHTQDREIECPNFWKIVESEVIS